MSSERSAAQGRGPNYKMSPVHVPSAATKREPLLKWLRSPCDAPNWLFIVLSLLLVIVSLFDLTGVGK